MKQKKTKPRPTSPKGQRWPSTSEEWDQYVEKLAEAEHDDWIGDCELRKYKKSDKYKQGEQLANQFKKRAK